MISEYGEEGSVPVLSLLQNLQKQLQEAKASSISPLEDDEMVRLFLLMRRTMAKAYVCLNSLGR